MGGREGRGEVGRKGKGKVIIGFNLHAGMY